MPINSKDKGKRGERMWRNVCRSHGFDKVRRTAQYCGNTGDASDCVGLPNIHQEVKFVENLNVRKAYEQAEHDAQKKWRYAYSGLEEKQSTLVSGFKCG